ncbi:MAG: class I SAM-dependent methyltransferase [Paracoccaceae bacterium]
MRRFYDPNKNRLVYMDKAASSEFWDKQWSAGNISKLIQGARNPIITGKTKKYLSKSSRVLEGGCGQGQYVYLLEKAGFNVIGVDYAKRTVEKINEHYPSLDIRYGDVRNLAFEDGFFDGYWSFGVIEHFYDGYDTIVSEIKRVLRPKGYLFMTVPTMSPLRKYLSRKGRYPIWEGKALNVEAFYQFALDPGQIISDFESAGFELCEMKPYGGLKGLKDEVPILKPFLQPIFDHQNVFVKVIKKLLDYLFQPFAAHTTLFVFRKR